MRLSVPRLFFISVACTCLMAAVEEAPALPEPSSQAFRDGTDLTDLAGVWRSRGYGWLLSVESCRAHFYDESARHCVEDPDATEDVEVLAEGFQISENGRTIRLPLGDASYRYTFDKIDALPEICRFEPDPGPESVLDAVIDLFTRHYAFFKTRNIDWPSLVGSSRASMTTEASSAQLLETVKTLVSKFDDDHVSLAAKIDGRPVTHATGEGATLGAVDAYARRGELDIQQTRDRWMGARWRRDIGDTLLAGAGRTDANDKVRYGLIDGDIGYLGVRSMEDFVDDTTDDESGDLAALDRALDGAMALFEAARAVIVDVSLNDGGFDTAARLLARRFASRRTLGYYKYAGDSKLDRPQAIYLEPGNKRRFTGPVYLITSDVTVSAAEILTLSMRALPNVTHVGGTTRGALSDMLWKPLPNGWSLSLSNEVYLDADRKPWEGKGIPPEIPLQVFSRKNVTVGHLKAVRAVVDLIRQ